MANVVVWMVWSDPHASQGCRRSEAHADCGHGDSAQADSVRSDPDHDDSARRRALHPPRFVRYHPAALRLSRYLPTVFYVGYDDHYMQADLIEGDRDGDDIDDQLFFTEELRRTNRAIFVKLQYLLRY